jgi:hypothetical protein
MMVVEAKPLAEITHEAIKILYQKLGIVNTVRFLSQFTVGYGNYTEEWEALFGHLTLDEVISEIKQSRSKASTSE